MLVVCSLGAYGQGVPRQEFTVSTPPRVDGKTSTATRAVAATIVAREKALDGEWKKVKGPRNENVPSPQKQDFSLPPKATTTSGAAKVGRGAAKFWKTRKAA